MKRKLNTKHIALVLIFVMIFQYLAILFPFLEAIAETYTDVEGIVWEYEINSDGNAVNIKPKNKSSLPENIVIPSTVVNGSNTYNVKSIASNAFE